MEYLKRNDIAIIGMSCTFPGAKDLTQFWNMLCAGCDAVSLIKAWRDPAKSFPDWAGGFVDDIARFDNEFFNISMDEAKRMDPQQRMMLETSWQALQDAGISPKQIAGSDTGVFIGVMGNEWAQQMYSAPKQMDIYSGTGNGLCMIANRLSYFYNFHGPSLSIDTACSSSLVAVDLACQALKNNRIPLALVGGVNVIILSSLNVFYKQASLAAKDGRCKPFSSYSDGIGRGEGAGMVVLKPLQAALLDGNNIYAIIKGSAVNHDGFSNGITAPNRWMQKKVIEKAYQDAGIAPQDVDYIETHGTGTALGDPIEINALGSVVGINRTKAPCLIGSVKGNLAHLEGAAGIAGIIKLALSIYYKKIPPSLHYGTGNQYINFAKNGVQVQTELTDWSKTAKNLPLAGVSSFGLGGTNAHVVLSGIHQTPAVTMLDEHKVLHCLKVTAKSPTSLRKNCEILLHYLDKSDNSLSLYQFCYTMNVHREDYPYGFVVLGRNKYEFITELQKQLDQQVTIQAKPKSEKLAFLFTSSTLLAPNMMQTLYQGNVTYQIIIDECAKLLEPKLNCSLHELLYSEENLPQIQLLRETFNPLLIAIQDYALAKVWESIGICPNVLLGFGVGEYVAAVMSDVFSLEDMLKLLLEYCSIQEANLDNFIQVAKIISYKEPKKTFISSVTGEQIKTAIGFQHWCDHANQHNQFDNAIFLSEKRFGCSIFLEMGIGSKKIEKIKHVFSPQKTTWLASLNNKEAGYQQFYASGLQLYQLGQSIHWKSLYLKSVSPLLGAPTYAFTGQEYWLDDTSLPITEEKTKSAMLVETNQNLVYRQIRQLVAEVAAIDASNLTEDSEFIRHLDFDSLMLMQLKVKLDKTIVGASEVPISDYLQAKTLKDVALVIVDRIRGSRCGLI